MGQYDELKLSNQICFPLYACSKEVVRAYKPFLDELDLTYTQYITMMVVWERAAISVKELGEYVYLDSGTLTPVLKALERKGYIRRRRFDEDERVLIVTMTKEGRALRERAREIPSKIGSCVNLSEDDAKKLYELLYKVLNQLRD